MGAFALGWIPVLRRKGYAPEPRRGMIHEFNRLDVVQVSEQRFARNLDLQFVWQFVAHEGGTRDRPADQLP